jgi:hypothetical protein
MVIYQSEGCEERENAPTNEKNYFSKYAKVKRKSSGNAGLLLRSFAVIMIKQISQFDHYMNV